MSTNVTLNNNFRSEFYSNVTLRVFSGMVVNGFVNVVITTIERRFGLRSSQTGLIAGGYDIASFLTLVPVSFLGGRSKASKPRYICPRTRYVFAYKLLSRLLILILISIHLDTSHKY